MPLFLEYEAVLSRPDHLEAAGLSRKDIGVALDALASFVDPVEPFFLWRPQLRDADDDMVLEAAVNGRADALVTYNLRDFAAASRFGLYVAKPLTILERLL